MLPSTTSKDTALRQRAFSAATTVVLSVVLLVALVLYLGWHLGNRHDSNRQSFTGTVVAVNDQHNAIVVRSDKGGIIAGMLAWDGVAPPSRGKHVSGVLVKDPNVVYIN